MKTWKFVAEVMWLFLEVCLCPHSGEQPPHTDTDRYQRARHQTTVIDFLIERWYSPNYVRPPPRRA
jgi:hypothetical protein